ncbi:MAG: acyl carrier protein, partial [Umezawaea sp.]
AEFLRATGLRPLSAPQSVRLMSALLAGPEPYSIVCSAEWATYKSILEARAERPVLRRIEVEAAADDGSPSAIRDELLAVAPDERQHHLDRYVREQLAQLLRLDVAELAGEFHLLDMGLDSLMVMELISRSRKDLGVEIKSHEFFATDANFWAEFLLRRVEEGLSDPGATDTADAAATRQGW